MAMPIWFKRLLLIVVTTLSLLLIVLFLLAAGLYWMWKSEPAHWTQYQQWKNKTPVAERQALAASLEERVLAIFRPGGQTETSAFGEKQTSNGLGKSAGEKADQAMNQLKTSPVGSVHDFSMTPNEANAWLEQRLPKLLESQKVKLPEEVKEMMIAVEGSDLVFSFRFETSKMNQIFSAVVQPEIIGGPERPQVKMKLQGLRGGNMPLPTNSVESSLQDVDRGKAQNAMQSIVQRLSGAAFDFMLPSPAGPKQQLRLTDLRLGADQIHVQLRQEEKLKTSASQTTIKAP